MSGEKRLLSLLLVLLLVFTLVPSLLGVIGDYFWFNSLRLESVFITIVSAKLYLGLLGAALFFSILYLNWLAVKRIANVKAERIGNYILLTFAFFALIAGVSLADSWQVVLKFLEATGFGVFDPVLHQDVSFYVFTLPFLRLLLYSLLSALFISLLVSLGLYLYYVSPFSLNQLEEVDGLLYNLYEIKEGAKNHLATLIGLIFLLIAGLIFLQRYELLFSGRGPITGATYTDIHVKLPLLTLEAIVAAIVGLSFIGQWKLKRVKISFIALAALIVIYLLGALAGGAVQQFKVEPNEFEVEKPYINRNINHTLQAYGLDEVKEVNYRANYNLTTNDLESASGTINNIRLWDWRPLQDTYSQLQLIRTYYDFKDVDTGRYYLKSEDLENRAQQVLKKVRGNDSTIQEEEQGEYTQVMLSARELSPANMDRRAQTWINRRLVYTHGYGLVMSPVSQQTQEGLPQFLIKDVPPKSKTNIELTRPEIYYGEVTKDYVIANTKTKEFDYPQGEQNVYSHYQGTGGISLDQFKRFIFSLNLGSINLLISPSIKQGSRLMLYRNIKQRVRKVAPFLHYDSDPYLVTVNGSIYWIQDAYTTTNNYPYAEPSQGLNYIRNSVKVVINAYNGRMNFYVMDSEQDPLIKTYEKLFPQLFQSFEDMPTPLQQHVRFPEDLFQLQSEIYSTFHMRDPQVFYNKEDIWQFPDEVYSGRKIEMEPYYILMSLPSNGDEAEFVLMVPFTPKGKKNLIGWLGARSDPPHYGQKIVYKFPKQELIYGPMQIESRIDQNTDISQKLTLWSQRGSRVIRGNLLVIPIRKSLLYVEPIYLQGTEEGSLPELKRVIVGYGDQIVMEANLQQALDRVLRESGQGQEEEKEAEQPGQEEPDKRNLQELIEAASDYFQQGQDALKQGNLSSYAERMDRIGDILRQLTANETK